MKKIPLSQGKFAIVDDDDYEFLSKRKWHFNSNGYAVNCVYVRGSGHKNQKSILTFMHRLIMDVPKGLHTDHINGDKLDNRRSNLRICTNKENSSNQRKKAGSSKYKGVYWHKQNKNWVARIRVNYKKIHLGVFLDEDDAARSYNQAAIKNFGDFARINTI